MKNNPLISVIIPTFNSEKTIYNCIKSVLNQNFRDYEICVMDGFSKDQTSEIVSDLIKSNSCIHWFSEKDNGIYDAVNKGIQKAGGEWIYILGSDDILSDENVLNSIQQTLKESKSDFIYGNVKVIGDAGWANDGDIYNGEYNLEKLLKSNICQQAVFYRKSVFNKVGYFNVHYKICADWEMALRIFSKYSFQYVPVVICNFNGGGTSAARNDDAFSRDLISNLIHSFGFKLIRSEFIPYKYRIIEFGNESRRKFRYKLWWKCRKIYNGLESLSSK